MFTQLPRSPRAVLLATATLGLSAGVAAPATAQAAGHSHARHAVRAVAADAAEREARMQEREAARAERLALREQRRAARAQEREARREARHRGQAGANGAADTTSGTTAPGSLPSPSSARGCRVSIETSAPRITAGESVTVFGKVTCPASGASGAGASGAAAGQQLTIEQSTRDHEAGPVHAFAALGSVSTESDGSWQLEPVTLQANTVFRVHLGRHGAHTGVHVGPVVTLNAPTPEEPAAQPSSAGAHSHQARHSRMVFTGTVAPATPGARVALQVSYPADGEQWHTIAFGHVVDGGFSIVHALRIPGEAKLRVLAHPKGANSPGVSEPVSYTVPQPQNPQLTIQAAANPISFGQTVALSGVAQGTAGQTVTLLARTAGGAFAPVATTTTDEAGGYAFTQAPQRNTYYEVSDSAARSVALFVGVKYALTLDPPASAVAAGEALSVSGSVAPARAGAHVFLERRGPSGFGFHEIASATVAADGTFTLAHAFESATTATLRVRIGSDAQNLGGASAPFAVTISAGSAATLAPEPDAPAS